MSGRWGLVFATAAAGAALAVVVWAIALDLDDLAKATSR